MIAGQERIHILKKGMKQKPLLQNLDSGEFCEQVYVNK